MVFNAAKPNYHPKAREAWTLRAFDVGKMRTMRAFWFLAIVGVLGCAILLSLGTWQLKRLNWKTAILAEIETRISQDAQSLPAAPDPEMDRYLPVEVQGFIGNQYLRVLVSDKAFGASYRIVSALDVGGRYVMIDRGVVPVDEQPPAGHFDKVHVVGNLHWPDEVDGFTPPPDVEKNIWYARDIDAMAKALDTEPVLIVLREPSFYDTPVRPAPITTAGIPNNHLQYTITWFSLAAIWGGMTVHFLRRAGTQPKGSN